MRTHSLTLTLYLTLFFLASMTEVRATTLHISVAASMTDVFSEIISDFSTRNPDIVIRPNFGPSGGLAKQIYMGVPTDLYISANPEWMRYLQDNKMIAESSVKVFAHNQLVLIGSKTTKDVTLEQLIDQGKVGLGNPHNVPAGRYARQALEKLGLYTLLLQQGKLVMAKDVRQALVYAERGETEYSFVYTSDAQLAIHSEILYRVPPPLHEPINYPLALTRKGEQKQAAKSFYNFVMSKESSTILEKHGFILPRT